MKWRDRRQSSNVDDRRSSTGGRGGGRGLPSIGTLMFLWPIVKPLIRSKLGLAVVGIGAAAYFLAPQFIGGGSSKPANQAQDNEQAAFISTVHGDLETIWGKIFKQARMNYRPPELVLYRSATQSGCGPASSRMGPFYCPEDEKVYVDLGFFADLKNKHGAGGDFASAYVLAHEIGHHVQNMEGTLDQVQKAKQRARGGKKENNKLQVMVELQADCYAGVWAHHEQKQFGALESGDLEEALTAAAAIGDDRLQKQAQGFAIPHTFTHGSSKQRVEWFSRGVRSGRIQDCQTFSR